MGRKKRVDDELKRDLSEKDLKEFCRKAGLPGDYPTLSPVARKKARFASLTSWFDPSQPNIFCTDTEAYVKAHFLFTEFFMKPSNINQGTYYYDDSLNKEDMLRSVMSPPLRSGKPSKTIVTATRRIGKTQTLIVEGVTLISLVRPFTLTLISEYNATRTEEEIGKIKEQVEENEIIEQEFGGEGVLFPKKSTGTWKSTHLKFLHLPGSQIMGHSMKSAQRGRGPLYGIIDDPEDEEVTYNKDWRRWFFSRLFDAFERMFHSGGKICWIGTPIHGGSCLSQAMKGKSEKEEQGDDSLEDKRFRDWRKYKCSLISKDEEGNWTSMQPQRLSIPTFLEELELNPVSVRKEILCEPVTPGTRAFNYDSHRHGFMFCDGGESDDYVLDLLTGEETETQKFLDELVICGAGDVADGQSRDADPGALVWVGANPRGTVFVLDCWGKRCLYDTLLEMAYIISEEWKCGIFGWERAALLCVINRIAKRYVEELREQGKSPPVFRELENAKRNKVARILSLSPLFKKQEIRFRQFTIFEGPDGKIHKPCKYNRINHYRELISQIVEFTDEGIRGHDDMADGLEMAVRLLGSRRGVPGDLGVADPSDRIFQQWRKLGVSMEVAQVPVDVRTPVMEEELEQHSMPVLAGVVPYV